MGETIEAIDIDLLTVIDETEENTDYFQETKKTKQKKSDKFDLKFFLILFILFFFFNLPVFNNFFTGFSEITKLIIKTILFILIVVIFVKN